MKTWERILADLRERRPNYVCGAEWYAKFTPTYAQRISLDIKPRGYVIESRRCKRHAHSGSVHEYRLLTAGIPCIPTQSEALGLSSERFDATGEVSTHRGQIESSGRSGTAEQRPGGLPSAERIGSGSKLQTPPALRGAQARPATWEPEADDPANELLTEADRHTAEQLSLLAGGETAPSASRLPHRASAS